MNALELIKSTKGKIFTVVFIKKNGDRRVMNARLGVKKYLKKKKLAFNPKDYDLLPVYDLVKKDYRLVNLSTIQEVRFGKEIWKARK